MKKILSPLYCCNFYGTENILVFRKCEQKGATVKISTADTTTKEGCVSLFQDSAPVVGIFNLAIVLKDMLFENQTLETFNVPIKSKTITTKNLDQISRKMCPKLE